MKKSFILKCGKRIVIAFCAAFFLCANGFSQSAGNSETEISRGTRTGTEKSGENGGSVAENGTGNEAETETESGNESGSQKVIFTPRQQQLRISAKDIKLIEDKENGGYHLYVKKNPKVNSILLTETTKDPLGKSDSYAYRAKEYNSINGDEIRYLNGKKLESEGAKFSLVDSTVEKTDFFEEAFHIYIPKTIVYGYEWSRNGEVELGKGTFINIRSFEKPYADYSGDYMDSPFMFDLKIFKKPAKKVAVVEKKVEKKPVQELPKQIEEPEVQDEVFLTDNYNPIASEKFAEISQDLIYSKGPESIVEDIGKILEKFAKAEKLDLVFAIDATGSMHDDIDKLRADLIPEIKRIFNEKSDVRIGLLFYRDYGDTFKYMDLPVKCYSFTRSFDVFEQQLNSVKILGREGGDIPEAVYEAMYAASEFYKWRGDAEKQVILIGDAQPHPTPRGTKKYSKDYVMEVAKSRGVNVQAILLPQDY